MPPLAPTSITDLDAATRRDLLRGTGALTLAGLLAACGDGATTDAASGAPTTDGGAPAADLPADPQRVVVIEGRGDLDHALALELPVVGYPANTAFGDEQVSPHLAEALAARPGAEAVYDRGEISVEAIAAAEPDLILSRTIEAEEFAAELAAVAAVLPVRYDVPWQEESRRLAEQLGRLDVHEALIERYEARVAEIRRLRADVLDQPILVVQFGLGEAYVAGPTLVQPRLIADLGGRLAPIHAEVPEGEFSLTVTEEEYDRVLEGAAAAHIVINTDEELAAFESSPLISGAPLVEEERFVVANFFSNSGGPLTALGVLDELDAVYATLQV